MLGPPSIDSSIEGVPVKSRLLPVDRSVSFVRGDRKRADRHCSDRHSGAPGPSRPPPLTDLTNSGQMAAMKQVKIAELKAGLSGYLSQVRSGERFVVCDRATPVAWLVPYGGDDETQVIAPKAPPIPAKSLKPVKLRRRVDVVALLRQSRDQR